MSGTAVAILVACGVGVILLAVAAYYIVRFMRGSIKLTLPRRGFNAGDAITGSFEMHTKKEIQGKRLIVSLIGIQSTTRRQGDETRTESREVYRDETLIEEARVYPAGHSATHTFELTAPNTGNSEFLNSPLGSALTSALKLLSNRRTRMKWKVEARLDAKGVDLANSQTVSINL